MIRFTVYIEYLDGSSDKTIMTGSAIMKLILEGKFKELVVTPLETDKQINAVGHDSC